MQVQSDMRNATDAFKLLVCADINQWICSVEFSHLSGNTYIRNKYFPLFSFSIHRDAFCLPTLYVPF